MTLLFLILIAYLFGSIPFSLIVSKLKGINLKEEGTKNLGASNVGLTAGFGWGVMAMLLDLSKGFFPVVLSRVMDGSDLAVVLAAFFAILGHDFPIFLKFKGGKGLATTGGAFFAIEPLLLGSCILIYGAILLFVRHFILSTLILITALPFFTWAFGLNIKYILFSIGATSLIYFTHRKDIISIINNDK